MSYENEEGYLKLLKDTLENGDYKKTRNGYVYSSFGNLIKFDISTSFPLLTTKKVFLRGIIEELLWFLRGSTNSKDLEDKGINIWRGNSTREYLDNNGFTNYEEGELGPIYGWQWRNFNGDYKNNLKNGTDQLKYVITELLKPDNSRRAILTSWNPEQLTEQALPPCHILYNFYKDKNGLSCMINMRSSDLFLGLPFNIASSSLLTYIIGYILNIPVSKIALSLTDAHIYEEHIEGINIQLQREIYKFPKLIIKKNKTFDNFDDLDIIMKWIEDLKYEDFELIDYIYNDTIKAPMK